MQGQIEQVRQHVPSSADLVPEPRQLRSRRTQERFIDAGWQILHSTPWENVSIAEISARAGRSIGVFYQRFGSKEDFLTYLLHRWLERGYADTDAALRDPAVGPEALIDLFLADAFDRIRRNRFLWRAALQRAATIPLRGSRSASSAPIASICSASGSARRAARR
ncbi:MAG: TetR/AcrR family transcriptional regulator [Sphingomonas sp.]